MKSLITFTVIMCFLIFRNNPAFSDDINLNQTFSSDTTFYPFSSLDEIYSLSVTGTAAMYSPSSLIRVLVNTNGGEYMVFEIYPLIASDSTFVFTGYCDETCFLHGVVPEYIRLEIIDASIDLNYFTYDTTYNHDAEALQYRAKQEKDHEKVDLMNKKITDLGMHWTAGNTSLVDLFYQDKKGIYQEDYNLLG